MKRPIGRLLVCLAAAAAAACASTPGEEAAVPDFTPIRGEPLNERSRLYVDCVRQAAVEGEVDRTTDADSHLIRFTCSGAPARAFYDALAPWSAQRDSQWAAGGRTGRSTEKVRRDLFGVDHCWTDGGADHRCVVVLNTGRFAAD